MQNKNTLFFVKEEENILKLKYKNGSVFTNQNTVNSLHERHERHIKKLNDLCGAAPITKINDNFYVSVFCYYDGHLQLNLYELKQGKGYVHKNQYKLNNKKDPIKQIDNILAKYFKQSLEGVGNIYLVSDGTYTKIGATTYNVTKRLNELQVGNAKILTPIGNYIAVRRMATEKLLKDRYAKKNVRGEWFNLSQNDIYTILSKREQAKECGEYQFLTQKLANQIISDINLSHQNTIELAQLIESRFLNKLPSALYKSFGYEGTSVNLVKFIYARSIAKEYSRKEIVKNYSRPFLLEIVQ